MQNARCLLELLQARWCYLQGFGRWRTAHVNYVQPALRLGDKLQLKHLPDVRENDLQLRAISTPMRFNVDAAEPFWKYQPTIDFLYESPR